MTHTCFLCPPHNLKLSEGACAAMKALAGDAAAHPKREGSASIIRSKRACIDCIGVKALAKMWRIPPDEIDVSKLTPPRSIAHRSVVSVQPPQIEGPRIGRSIGEPATVPPGAKRGGRRA